MKITALRSNCQETDGFRFIQPRGTRAFSIFFFQTQVDLSLQGNTFSLQPGSCILYAPGAPQHFTARGTLVYSRLDATEDIAPTLLQYHLPLGQPFYLSDTEAVSEAFLKMEKEFRSRH